MANEKNKEVAGEEQTIIPVSKVKKTITKSVRNRGNYRTELTINGKVVVLLPGQTVEVPIEFPVPSGLGLYVR